MRTVLLLTHNFINTDVKLFFHPSSGTGVSFVCFFRWREGKENRRRLSASYTVIWESSFCFPASLCSASFIKMELNETCFRTEGTNGLSKGQVVLHAKTETCLVQHWIVLEARWLSVICMLKDLTPHLTLDPWGQSPYVQESEQADRCKGGKTNTTLQQRPGVFWCLSWVLICLG